jgi:hypothetical protein
LIERNSKIEKESYETVSQLEQENQNLTVGTIAKNDTEIKELNRYKREEFYNQVFNSKDKFYC